MHNHPFLIMPGSPVECANTGIINHDTTVCPGSTIHLSAKPALSYAWSPGKELNNSSAQTVLFTADSNMQYQLISTISVAGKTVSCTDSVSVMVIPTPAVDVSFPRYPPCFDSLETFTAITKNISNPVYQWQISDIVSGVYHKVGTNSPNFSMINKNEYYITCTVSFDQTCFRHSTLTSKFWDMDPAIDPSSIQIATNPDSICSGQTNLFKAVVVNGSFYTSFNWKLNGIDLGDSTDTYINSSVVTGDKIYCELISGYVCTTKPPSNIITLTVYPTKIASVGIAASATNICSDSLVIFTATAVNGGPAPSYNWLLNGQHFGDNMPVISSRNLQDGDLISCELNSSLYCTAPAVSQNNIQMKVDPSPSVTLDPYELIVPGAGFSLQPEITGNIVRYQWSPSAGLSDAFIPNPVASPRASTEYQLTVITDKGCPATANVDIQVFGAIHLPKAFTPNGDGLNDIFRILPPVSVTVSYFSVYDRWGNPVFSTANSGIGWDGSYNGKQQPTGTYVWEVEYLDPILNKKIKQNGTVILIR